MCIGVGGALRRLGRRGRGLKGVSRIGSIPKIHRVDPNGIHMIVAWDSLTFSNKLRAQTNTYTH